MKILRVPDIDGTHSDFAQRFRDALAWKGWLVYDLANGVKTGSYRKAADKLGVSGPYVEGLYRGRQFPSGTMGIEIANKLGVSANWLTNGDGPMIADKLISIEDLELEDQIDILTRLRIAQKKITDKLARKS